VAFGRGQRRTERAKLDATPPWGARVAAEQDPTSGPWDIRDAPEDAAPFGAAADGELADLDDMDLDDMDLDDEDAPSGDGAAARRAAGRPAARVDFGALQVPADIGLEVRVELTPEGNPTAVVLANSQGQMQLGVFAAPRTEGIWEEVRGEIRASIAQQGGSAQDREGPFGPELVGKLPQNGTPAPVRFLGVDGPRWFLRAMVTGPAAAERASGEAFIEAFRQLVVVRGDAALPVREPVPLTLPPDLADQIAAAAAGGPAEGGAAAEGAAPVPAASRTPRSSRTPSRSARSGRSTRR
jgi:hypothetical protein